MADAAMVGEGVVEEFGFSNNHKPKVKISGQWYYLGNTRLDGVAAGDTLSFEWVSFKAEGMRSAIRSLQSWGHVARSAPPKAPSAPPSTPPPSIPPSPGPVPSSAAQTPSPISLEGQPLYNEGELRLISNFMAAVAPKIEKPAQVSEWFRAIGCAVRGVEFFEEEIPF